MGRVLNKRNRIIYPKFIIWWFNLQLIRFWSLFVSATFSPKAG